MSTASKYRLISDVLYKKLMAIHSSSSKPNQEAQAHVQPAPKMDVQVDTGTVGDDDDDEAVDAKVGRGSEALIGMLPKSSRSKAEIVVKALGNKLKYDKSTFQWLHHSKDGEPSSPSHVVDLLRWSVATPLIAKSMHRPVDGQDWLRFLVENGVPKNVIRAQYERYMVNAPDPLTLSPVDVSKTENNPERRQKRKASLPRGKWLKY